MQLIAASNFVCLVGLEVYKKFSEVRYIPYNLSSKELNALKMFFFFTFYEMKITKEEKSLLFFSPSAKVKKHGNLMDNSVLNCVAWTRECVHYTTVF